MISIIVLSLLLGLIVYRLIAERREKRKEREALEYSGGEEVSGDEDATPRETRIRRRCLIRRD